MYVAGGRCLGRIGISVGIEPDEPYLLASLGVEAGHTGDRTDGDGVISTQNDRNAALAQGAFDELTEPAASFLDLCEVFQFWIAGITRLGDADRDVTCVLDLAAQLTHRLIHFGYPKRRWSHIHAAPAGT